MKAGSRSPLRALAVVSYRWFALAQVLGNGAMWMHRTAHVWLVVQISGGDGVAVGTVTGLQYISMIVLGLGGGALGDRFDKRRMLLITQSVVVVASLVLAGLIAAETATLPIAYLFAVLLGIPGALDAPIRLAYPRQLVPHEILAPAVGLNGAVFQLARVAGPAMAGGIIAFFGTAEVFAVVAVMSVVSCLALWRVRPLPGSTSAEAVAEGPRPGFTELFAPVYIVPLLGGLMLGIGMAHLQLAIPLLLDTTAGDAAGSFGTLTAMIGVGGIVGAGLAASVRSAPTDRFLFLCSAVFAAVTMVVSALSSGLALAAGLFVAGATMQVYGTSAISALQLRSPANVQGRLMALYVIAFFVWVPAGGPVFGWFMNRVGVRQALGLSGLGCLAVVGLLALWLRKGRGATGDGTAHGGPHHRE